MSITLSEESREEGITTTVSISGSSLALMSFSIDSLILSLVNEIIIP